MLAESQGWRAVVLTVAACALAVVPLVLAPAAMVAGSLRTLQVDYITAFGIAGGSGVVADVLALGIGIRPKPTAAA